MHSEGEGSYWPYIGVDRAVGYLLRNEPEKALDYFCALTDTAGGTLSWGEGYSNVIAGGDQPHFWADAQWINLFRQLMVFENGSELWITPGLLRRWQQPGNQTSITGLATQFGDLTLRIEPQPGGAAVNYCILIAPQGDQADRELSKIILYPRLPDGRPISQVLINGRPTDAFTSDAVVIARPERGGEIRLQVSAQ